MNLSNPTNAPSIIADHNTNGDSRRNLLMNTNTSGNNQAPTTGIDRTTRICRRITFLYANDMMNSNYHTNNGSTNHHPMTTTTSFHYLQQSSVPFHQSAYTIHEYSCGTNHGNHSLQPPSTTTTTTPKIVATTPSMY
jgi:hypothetical protein